MNFVCFIIFMVHMVIPMISFPWVQTTYKLHMYIQLMYMYIIHVRFNMLKMLIFNCFEVEVYFKEAETCNRNNITQCLDYRLGQSKDSH